MTNQLSKPLIFTEASRTWDMMTRQPANPPAKQAEAIMQSVPSEWQFFDAPMTWGPHDEPRLLHHHSRT